MYLFTVSVYLPSFLSSSSSSFFFSYLHLYFPLILTKRPLSCSCLLFFSFCYHYSIKALATVRST